MKWNVVARSWHEMKWNVFYVTLHYFFTVDVKWKLMKLFFREVREMRWNEVKFMKFMKCSETDLFPDLKDLVIVLISSRDSRPPRVHTYVSAALNSDKGCLGKSHSGAPWTRDSYGAWPPCESPRLSDSHLNLFLLGMCHWSRRAPRCSRSSCFLCFIMNQESES